MNRQHSDNNVLEPTTRALLRLSPQSQETVIALVRQLTEREGISVALAQSPGLQSPIEGIPWYRQARHAKKWGSPCPPECHKPHGRKISDRPYRAEPPGAKRGSCR